ncbi:hypothetical protein QFC19_005292 [Naganishia cerealis]|uniref:Uncharacterized protein n=1 Tax=Naganishia cerealis TaxID=610337 RepID=A0ACC2VQY5_9TREE|nr:hypothetical protein QFC19_005292 [Naganishia cerealis]
MSRRIDNYYDITLSSEASGALTSKKKYPNNYVPRRVASSASLTGDSKRPGDYFIQKLSNSSINLSSTTNQKGAPRPFSGDSIVSLPSSYSDEVSLLGSSQFDGQDSRLSSMTSHSITTPADSPMVNNNQFPRNDDKSQDSLKSQNELFHNDEDLASSVSTITLKNSGAPYNNSLESTSSLTSSAPHPAQLSKTRVKASSTSNILRRAPSVSSTSSLSLHRTKSKYSDPKEARERQQRRKKMYEENENDDEILSNDLDLFFNVPVIKNHADIYRKPSLSAQNKNVRISREDLISNKDDNYGSLHRSVTMKPTPLPPNLTSFGTNSSFSSTSDLPNTSLNSTTIAEHSIEEEDESREESTFSVSMDSDVAITQNISDFYSDRSVSFLQSARNDRDNEVMYKLPHYVKSQSSIEDLRLFSPEKLILVDQSRPINLPPKAELDKSKHAREFQKVLSNLEITSKSTLDSRKKLSESMIVHNQHWLKLILSISDEKDLKKKFNDDKNSIRRLNWDSVCPDKCKFQYLMKVLSYDSAKMVELLSSGFLLAQEKVSNLSPSMKATKTYEFTDVMNSVLRKPLYESIMKEMSKDDVALFRENYMKLLFAFSLSEDEDSLRRQDEILLIPVFLIMFQDSESLQNIYTLIKLIDRKVFNRLFFRQLGDVLEKWSTRSFPSSSQIYKFLRKFHDAGEFADLSPSAFCEMLTHMNDKLPLSKSAPSTPIVAQSGFNFDVKPAANFSPKTNSIDGGEVRVEASLCMNSAAFSLVFKLIQLVVTYSFATKTQGKNNMKVIQSFLMVVFKFYHINWNDYRELIRCNKSIRINNTADATTNLDSFTSKWVETFKVL